jgi:hypothetical protein
MAQQQEIYQSGEVPISQLLIYFLRLGTLGFGGPIALASRMESDLVRERNWISREDYLEGLALAQLAPGRLRHCTLFLVSIAPATGGDTPSQPQPHVIPRCRKFARPSEITHLKSSDIRCKESVRNTSGMDWQQSCRARNPTSRC